MSQDADPNHTITLPDSRHTLEIVRHKAQAFGLHLSDAFLDKLLIYQNLLLQWNRKINLTAITGPDEIVTHHFLDSLALSPHLPQTGGGTLVDVGSGAGFPGAICALLRPDWQVTLIERTQKKAAFLLTLRRELAPNLRVVGQDVAQVAARGDRFDVVVSRAAFPPAQWLRVGSALVAPGGLLLAMLTPHNADQPDPLGPPGFGPGLMTHHDSGAGPRVIRSWQRQHRAGEEFTV